MIDVVLSNAAFEPGINSPFILSWLLPTWRGSRTAEWPLLLNGDISEWRLHTTIANAIDIWLTLGIGAIPRSPLIKRMHFMLC